jgi:hypothetical protein
MAACVSENTTEQSKRIIDFKKNNLLSPQFFSETNLFNLSFPSWFDVEELERLNIDSIYIDIVVFNWINDTLFTEEKDYSLKYAFNLNGFLKKSVFIDYYGQTTLFEASFDYTKSTADSNGYCLPRIEKTANVLIGSNPTNLLRTLSDLQRFNRLELVSSDETIVFKNTTSPNQEHHIFIADPKNQNILFVDKLETNAEDVFYYGSPKVYTRAFCLTDLVKEELRSEVVFFDGINSPKAKRTQTNGLITKTVYNYDEEGRWMGQQDSLMLNTGQFVKLTVSEIVYDELDLPSRIDVKIGSTKDDLRLSKTIKLHYTIRKK